jgi:uncharacterized protein (DUF1330 family)
MKTLVAAGVGFVAGAALAGVGAAQILSASAEPRPATEPTANDAAAKPAYLVVLGEVLDQEKFARGYVAKLPPIYAKHGGVYLAAGRNFEVLEGEGEFKSFVISKWPSMDAVRSFWTSPEYDALRRARIDGNWGRFDVYALEGLPAPPDSPAR